MQDMTVGEMRAWTSRFQNILRADESRRNGRLQNLKKDLETATDYKNNPSAARLHLTVQEEMREGHEG